MMKRSGSPHSTAVRAAFWALVVFSSVGARGQTPCLPQGPARQDAMPIPENRGAAALDVVLKQLHTRASLLMITAHPDDEDGGMLAYEARSVGTRVDLLTLNRGEGGANVMSPDLWDSLGLVRTEELLQADRYYCTSQYFSIAADYGFSKSLKEALEKWGTERVFYDVVRVVRMTRPLVITSVFVGGPSDGHGHHAAAGMWAQKVFEAAGDPNVFPDQIKAGLRPWNPLKEYALVPFSLEEGHVSPKGLYDYATHNWDPAGVENYITGKFEPGAVSATVEIPTGTYNIVDGLSDQQISRTGLGFQKSQSGGARIPADGPAESSYHRFGSRIAAGDKENSFFEGIDTSLMGIADLAGDQEHAFLTAGLEKISGLVDEATRNYSAADPSAIAPTLAEGLAATDALITAVSGSSLSDDAKYDVLHELRVKQEQFNNAVALALGLTMSAEVTQEHPPTGPFARFMTQLPTFQMAIPGQQFPVLVHMAEASPVPVTIDKISLHLQGADDSAVHAEGDSAGALKGGGIFDARFGVQIPEDAPFTRPYFDRPGLEQAYYDLREPQYRDLPLAPYPLEAAVTASYHGVEIHLAEVVQTIAFEVGRGTVYQPMPIGPAISVTMQQSDGIVPLGAASFSVGVRIHSNVKGPAQGSVRLDMPADWRSEPATAKFSLSADGQEQFINFEVYPAHLAEQPYELTAVASYDGREYKQGYVETGYPGLRPYFLYHPADYRTTGTDVKIGQNLQVGYVEGSGDDVPASLENLGIHVHFLASEDLASGDLDKYNVILIGVRAYAVRPDLRAYNERLLNYVKRGGLVVVQYQTPEYDHDFGPYPYSMTSDPEEVTDEGSPMTFLDPGSPALNWPNKITAKDFEGWIEERGSKFMHSWDPRYEAPLETHDPGQVPQKGGLLIARYGSGVYVYTAYAFYRELPLGVPGAYRLFANLLSLQKNPLFKPAGE
ncbi:MAG TPA: PIG-L family deacetylase [Terracidiphilus sp.]|nr:PIG-L family deacetylase [Terracidiphilus sp.]